MKRFFLFLSFFTFFCGNIFSQIIEINNATEAESLMSLENLVKNVLISGDCAQVDNFTEQTFGDAADNTIKSYGYFKAPTGSLFPFEEGVVLTTGRAFVAGNTLSSTLVSYDNGATGGDGDTDLETALMTNNTNDATFIKFNFVPISDSISFRYIMASEEYTGGDECSFSDGFAFLLREVGTTTYKNLAVLPDAAETTVSVTNINTSSRCASNIEYFEGYGIDDTNYGGRTKVLTATSNVIPNKIYEIKIVVVDQNDSIYDSAIFLEAGSFVLDIDLGEPKLSANNSAICGNSTLLDANIIAPNYKWFKDGVVIPGEINQTYTANLGNGIYRVEASFTVGCNAEDEIELEFVQQPIATDPGIMPGCDNDGDGIVTFDLAANSSDILDGQNPSTFDVLYFLDAAYTDEISSTDISNFNSSGQTIYVRVINVNSNNCVADISFDTVVYTSAEPLDSGSIQTVEVCDNATVGTLTDGYVITDITVRETEILNSQLPSEFSLTYFTNPGYTLASEITDPVNFENTTAGGQLIYVRMTNILNSICYADTSFELKIFDTPIAIQPMDLILCDDDNNGTMPFDLSSQDTLINTATGISISYHPTQLDANTGASSNPLSSPFESGTTTIYARVENDGNTNCYDTTSFEIEVYDSAFPLDTTSILPIEACDNTTVGSDTDGFIVFDLTEREMDILNGQDATEFTLTYFTDAGYSNQIPNSDLTNFTNTIQDGQTIYVRMTNNSNTDCYTDTSFDINVFELPILNTAPFVLEQCDDDFNGFNSFNLTEINSDILTSITTEVFTYYESFTEAEAGISGTEISNPTMYINQVVNSDDTLWVRIENLEGCYRTTQVTLIVKPSAIPTTFLRIFSECDDGSDNRDGIATFNFSSVTAEIEAMFPTSIDVFYYKNQADATSELNEITDITAYQNIGFPNMQEIWVRADSQLGNDCLGNGHHITLIVEELPTANKPTDITECDDDGDGEFPFDISMVESEILGSQSLTDVTISYFNEDGTSIGTSLPNPFLTASQTIDIVVSNNSSNDPQGTCTDTTTLTFVVDISPRAVSVAIPPSCDDTPNDTDGISIFDTTTLENDILDGQTGMNVYYTDASGNPLTDSNGVVITSPFPGSFSTTSQTISVAVENPVNTTCIATATIDFIVLLTPEFDLEEETLVCENLLPYSISVENPNQSNYDYQWFNSLGVEIGTDQTLSIINTDDLTAEGVDYSVIVTNPITMCSKSKTILVKTSSLAAITEEDIITIEFNSPENTIEINTTNLGTGDYEFSLKHEYDFQPFQDEPIFTGLLGGIYTLVINDKNGCGETELTIILLDYPKFLTPNNDGHNDTWKLVGIESTSYVISPIQIFDRFGKIVAVLDPLSSGWDGYYNGAQLPASDYWFRVQLTDSEGTTHDEKGHFSLVRR